MKADQIKYGSILSYCQMAINIVVGLIYTPLMIRLLGQSEYGLYNTVASTISMLSILNLGFGSSYIRYYAVYKSKKDNTSIFKLNGLFLVVFIIIGLIALICGLYLTYHLDIVFAEGLSYEELIIAKKLMLLLTINLALSFPMSVFSSIVSANERFVFLKLVGMCKTILNPIISIPLLFLGYGSLAIVFVTIAVSLLVDFANIIYVFHILKHRFIIGSLDKGIFKNLFSYTAFIAISIIIDQINWNIDKVLLGRFKGTTAVAVYSVGATLQQYYQMFSNSITGIFTPRIHLTINSELSLTEKNKYITELFIQIGRVQFLILAFVCTEMIFFGNEFIYFWAGKEYGESYFVALLLIIPVTIPLIQNLGIEIQRAQNKHKFRSIIYSIMAVLNLLLSINLCKKYGPIGASIGTAISLLLANGLIMNIYYHKKCGINVLLFWKSIGSLSIGLIPSIIVGIILKSFLSFRKMGFLIGGICFYAFIYFVAMWTIGMNTTEKQFVKSLVRRKG